MKADNPFQQLALQPFVSGTADLATLIGFVQACVGRPPFEPLPDRQAYLEVLDDQAESSPRSSLQFQGFRAFLVLLVAELWARDHLIGLFAARNLWELAEQDPDCAALVESLLPALERHPACDRDPETQSLIAGLRGLFALQLPARPLSPTILEQLDTGLVFAGSGFIRQQLPWLLWNPRQAAEPPTWEGLLQRCQGAPEQLRAQLLAIYSRAFFALRYGRIVKRKMESQEVKSQQITAEGAKEILATPGLEYLDPGEVETLRGDVDELHQGLLKTLQSYIDLLNRANRLLRRGDPWPLLYPIKIATAKVCLWGFAVTGNTALLAEARRFALHGGWLARSNLLLFSDACHLRAKIYRAWGKAERAQRLWKGMLRRLDKARKQDFFADLAASAHAQLAQLALEGAAPTVALDHALEAIEQARGHLAGSAPTNSFNLDDWSGNLLDTAIAAAVACGRGEKALEVFERWYSAGSLSRHLGLTPADASTLRKSLPGHTALVYLCLDQGGSSQLLVTPSAKVQCRRGEFGWNDLKIAIGPWLKAIEQLRAAAPEQSRQRLSWFQAAMDRTLAGLTPLLQPLAKTLRNQGVTRVILIPGRGLGGLPLHAVPLGEGREGGGFFGDAFDLLYAPNATVWLAAQRAQTARSRENRFAGFASADAGFSTELEQGAALWNAAEPPRVNASPLTFLQVAGESAVLHISCHGWFRIAENQAGMLDIDAGLDLGGGRLGWRNLLQRLRLPRARLVVLSACESLLLSHRDILNQQFGLPYAFLAAGAPLLLGSSWMVEAQATTLLVTRFHQQIRRDRQSSSRALAEAQQWLRSCNRTEVETALANCFGDLAKGQWIPEGEHPYQHPYWWAGFRLIGADLVE